MFQVSFNMMRERGRYPIVVFVSQMEAHGLAAPWLIDLAPWNCEPVIHL